MADSKPVGVEIKAAELKPGKPVPADAVTQQGSTFAERAKAAAKNVDAESVEDKAVAKKSASKKG